MSARAHGLAGWLLATAFTLFAPARPRAAQEPAVPVWRIGLTSPLDFQVVQRSSRPNGVILVAGSLAAEAGAVEPPDILEARVTGVSGFGELPGRWQTLLHDSGGTMFRGELRVPAGGWYRLEVRALRADVQVGLAVVEHVGVGEIFVIAGQSNAANYGEERQATKSGLVASFDGKVWQPARDPQPGAGGTKGSFLPPFGDEIVGHFHVPVGLVAVGIGSTSVREWLPGGTRLTQLPPLTRNVVTNREGQWEASGRIFLNFTSRLKRLGPYGFRAVLWHQGESDAHQADPERTLPGALYRQYLEQLIRDSRRAIGWEAPWFVAQTSYHNPGDPASADIRAAQKSMWEEGIALPGPDTDSLTGDLREQAGAGVHFSGPGLRAHAQLWFQTVSPWLEQQLVEAGN
jgi:hypothetical protein